MAAARGILAVIVGYLAMAVWVIVTMAVSGLVLGESFAFREGTRDASLGWCVLQLVLGFLGAMLGGWVASLISRSPTRLAVKILAALVLALGIVMAVDNLRQIRAGGQPQTAEQPEAALAVQPVWFSFTLPFVSTAGVLFGGSLRRRAQAPASAEA